MTIKPRYSVLIRSLPEEDGGGWIGIVPDLPGCTSDGDTPMEALKNTQDAIEVWLATAHKHGHPIPREDSFIQKAFEQDLPDHLRRQAEQMARDLEGLGMSQPPNPGLVNAIYAEMARSAIQSAHL